MARSISRGRFDRGSPANLDISDPYHGTQRVEAVPSARRAMKNQPYTPRGASMAPSLSRATAGNTYSAPPRSPLDAARSASRGRFVRGREDDGVRDYGQYDDRRDPLNEGRSYVSGIGRSASSSRQRIDDDSQENSHHSIGGGSPSAQHARKVLSKIRNGRARQGLGRERAGVAGQQAAAPLHTLTRRTDSWTDPSSPDLHFRAHGSAPQRAMERDDITYAVPCHGDNYSGDAVTASHYEVVGMKEELKRKDSALAELRREMDQMAIKYEEDVNSVRSKLVSAFKNDMQEMKNEWEDAFQKLKDEADSSQRAVEIELSEVRHAKAELESEMNEVRADHRTRIEDERVAREEERNASKEREDELKERMERVRRSHQDSMEEMQRTKDNELEELKSSKKEDLAELKRSKDEALERLRSMYEEHLDSTKRSASSVEAELKEEIHALLNENEKVKMCFEALEGEMQAVKADLEEQLADLKSDYEKAISENVRWEKEVASVKDELDDVLEENEVCSRRSKALEGELGNTKGELERLTSDHQRLTAEKARFEKEYNAKSEELNDMTRAHNEAQSEHNELLKKLDATKEEQQLESRYTEALVKQRDNLNAIVENNQREIDELKDMNDEVSGINRQYINLGKEFRLANGDPSTLRKELNRAEQFVSVTDEFRISDSAALREELVRLEQFSSVAEKFHLADSASMREELVRAEKLRDRLEALGRERERYNGTVKALKVDLKALHGGGIGIETSLQEHMRLLNEIWDANNLRLKQNDELKGLLEESTKEQERIVKDHQSKVESIERDLKESQKALVKVERERVALEDKLSDRELMDAKNERAAEELKLKSGKLEGQLVNMEKEQQQLELRCKDLETEKRQLQAELDNLQSRRTELESNMDKMDDVKKGLTKRLESAYYDLEEAQRELSSVRQDHEEELRTLEAELSKLPGQRKTIDSQEENIRALREALDRTYRERDAAIEEAKAEAAQLNGEYTEQKHKDEIEKLRARCKHLEKTMKAQKENLDQKSMVEIKRRGEFAKQKQDLEILRSKERHLETHVNQLEEHISKIVADYESKLENSNDTVRSSDDEEIVELKKQVDDLEKKLKASSSAMKQIGKSSVVLEKENERLKHDKNELKLKLKKLVNCAEI